MGEGALKGFALRLLLLIPILLFLVSVFPLWVLLEILCGRCRR
jgi:preprotein translocase subunit SecD